MFFIKSSKLLILLTILCIMFTNNSKASNNIEVLESNNIEHSSSVIERNMESVVIDNNHISESHNNNELNNNNVEHNNSEANNNEANLNHNDNINHENINNEHNNNSKSVNENAEQNNNDNVVLEVKEEGVQVGDEKKESLCNSLTTVANGILLIPLALYGGVAYNLVINNNKNISDSNTEMIRIRNQS